MVKELETEPRNASEVDTASEVKKLFASVLQPGEKIKVVTGQRVVLNESSVGKPRDDLSLEALTQIMGSALDLGAERVEIPTTEKGNPKAPEFEVLAIGEKGPNGLSPTRTLFRQERGSELPISVNLLADYVLGKDLESEQEGNTTEKELQGPDDKVFEPLTTVEDALSSSLYEEESDEWSPSDDPGLDDANYYSNTNWAMLQNADVVSETEQTSYSSTTSQSNAALKSSDLGQEEYDENDYLEGQSAGEADRRYDEEKSNIQTSQSLASDPAIADRSASFTVGCEESYFADERVEEASSGNNFSPVPETETDNAGDRPSNYEDAFASDYRTEITEEGVSSANPAASEDIGEPAIAPTSESNTIAALFQCIEQLPEDSPARDIAEKIATDILARESEVIEREEKAQTFRSSVKTGLSSLKSFADNMRKGAAEAIDAVRHPSARGIAGFALKTAGQVTRASGRGLKATGQYLQSRAEKLDEYGMAKAAVAIYEKGHSRTGENSFSKDGYTVEKTGNQYTVLNSENQSVMEFKTNRKGQPIRVVQTDTAQSQDKRALKKIARSPIILGSSEKEAIYESKVRAIIESLDTRLDDGHELSGNNFKVSKRNGDIKISTKTGPFRTATIDREDEVQSNLTREDVNYLSSQMVELAHRTHTNERQPVASQMAM